MLGASAIKCSCASVSPTGHTSRKVSQGFHFRVSAGKANAPTGNVYVCRAAYWRQDERPGRQGLKNTAIQNAKCLLCIESGAISELPATQSRNKPLIASY